MSIAVKDKKQLFLNKVPEVTLIFWIIKVMATTVGETGADFLIFNLHIGLSITSLIMIVALLLVLLIQLQLKRYIPWIYWAAVVMISIVGTLITDNLTDNLGISLITTTLMFSIGLMGTFAGWYATEKTLSIHSIFTRKRELFYWAAILFTFSLGTAAGDLLAENFKLGYATSSLIFGALIFCVTFAHYFFKVNAILSFWLAYILTRPFGASMGDYLTHPIADGGVGLGTIGTSIAFLSIITGLVVYLSISKKG